jgi:hypothetical protein
MVYFVKCTKTDKGIVVAEKPIGETEFTINGVTKRTNLQGGRLGFIAVLDGGASDLHLEKDDVMKDFVITDKPVLDQEKKPISNLFWATKS